MSFLYSDSQHLRTRRLLYERFSKREETWDSWLLKKVRSNGEFGRVLDIGGGYGSVWSNVSGESLEIVLTDISFGMLRDAVGSERGNFARVVVAAERLAFKDNTFDIVTAFNVLYHVNDRRSVYREVLRVLKPRGAFLLTTTGRNHLKELRDLVSRHAVNKSVELVATGFHLEDAQNELSALFRFISVEVFPDVLEIDDASAVVDYIRSTPAAAQLTSDEMRNIQSELHSRIAQQGCFRVRTEAGIASCHQPIRRSMSKDTGELRCPFCSEDPLRNEYWIKVARFSKSKLCLCLDQTYRGQSLLIFQGERHVEELDLLEEAEYETYMEELQWAIAALRRAFLPDHVNVELLGNVVPHLHFHIIPRYRTDPRWGMPVWTTCLADMPKTLLSEEAYRTCVTTIREALSACRPKGISFSF